MAATKELINRKKFKQLQEVFPGIRRSEDWVGIAYEQFIGSVWRVRMSTKRFGIGCKVYRWNEWTPALWKSLKRNFHVDAATAKEYKAYYRKARAIVCPLKPPVLKRKVVTKKRVVATKKGKAKHATAK